MFFLLAFNAGFFNTQKREAPMKHPMTDPSMMTEMLKGNVLNVLPMLVIGGWINWAFSGFLTSKNKHFCLINSRISFNLF